MATIEKGVPAPEPRAAHGVITRLIKNLEVGDSALMIEFNHKSVKVRAGEVSKKTGRTFTVRNTEEGLRIWRLA